ncbi:MATE family efflux transporter [Vibrio sp. SS-MA-C1-2]|uniref:MATE family efflux transporter n=1 Tax=Vibrio sp. SS-MA-C1-2 TaxID=2908646 RepID=UPI001F3C0FBE|nr:MATE family efflux transporter [Vibrio sp. SS-MA-C1-2]UJF18316.1 MATE family efflux transporter [Vibrio sp. SS-MA-C1-2]
MQRYMREFRTLAKLATPVLLAQVAQTSMGFVDTIMAGGVSPTDMAAVAIAASIWLPAILFGIGLLIALVPVIAQLNGSGKESKVPFEVHQGAYLAILTAIPIMLLLYNSQHIIGLMDIEPSLEEKTNGYLHAVIWAAPAFLLFQTLRSFAEGLSFTVPAMVIGFIGLIVNIPLNWIFVYGKFGAPALGGVGCGVATAIVYWVMFLSMLAYVLIAPRLRKVQLLKVIHPPKFKEIWRLFSLGFPVASAMFFEVTLFAIVALIIAPLGSVIVAAHQVAMSFSSMVFMIPLSVGSALSIRVGYLLGAHDAEKAKISSYCGIIMGLLLAMFTAIITWLFNEQIAYLYNKEPDVILLASHLMIFAAIYQCTDAIQVVAIGALRGYKDMNAIFVRTFIAYWLLGFPIGYILAMTDWIVSPMGPSGFWIGFIIGLTSAAVMLCQRLLWIHKQSDKDQLALALR